MLKIRCPYCDNYAKLVTGDKIYPHIHKLRHKLFYLCRPCDAYVGTHSRGYKPLGSLANKELRRARMAAHRAFDPIWKKGNMDRSDAYLWLSERLGIPQRACHIGMFGVEACNQVVSIIKSMKPTIGNNV